MNEWGVGLRAYKQYVSKVAALAAGAFIGASAFAAAPWGTPIMQPGIGAVSCAAPSNLPVTNAFVLGLLDFRNPPSAFYGPLGFAAPLWNPPMYHHPDWTVTNIGSIFGITIDADGDIYVAAHGLYTKTWFLTYHHRYGAIAGGPTNVAAAGTIYKIDRNTGVPSIFNTTPLPQQVMNLGGGFFSGPGIGNLAYDKEFDQFFVTSLEDGKIYRLDNAGNTVQVFDPIAPDNGLPGMPDPTNRIWGVGVSARAVHYAVWNKGDTLAPGKIRRVDLDGTGAMVPSTDVEILTVPPSPKVGGTPFVVVADITFSADGTKMVLGERTMQTETDSYNHDSRIHIIDLVGSTWTPARTLETGNSWGCGEAYGGVSYGPEGGADEQLIWGTSADTATSAGPHGLQGLRPADFPLAGSPSIVTNSYRVPFDPAYTTSGPDYKGSGGDVEIMQTEGCAELKATRILCPETNGGPFTVALEIKNLTTNTIHYVWFTPCPTSSLPAGAITAQPIPASVTALPTPLPPGGTTTVTVGLPAPLSGATVCFRATLLDQTGNSCCTQKICVTLPQCDCAEVIKKEVACEPQADGTIKYIITLTIKNNTHLSATPYGFANILFLPPAGFSPSAAIPTPNPIPPGGIGTVQTCYYGAPGLLCFSLSLHDDSLERCCAPERICLDLGDCPPAGGKPDTCSLDDKVPCCPPAGTATINYTICNNSTAPRTYNWSASGIASPGCSNMLTTANFIPSSGTIGPIPPGGCMTVPITVRCEGFKPGDCAGYQICASYNAAVPPLCCEGIVYRPKQGEPVVKHHEPGLSVPVGGATTTTFEIENPTANDMMLELTFADTIGILTFSTSDGSGPSPSLTTPLVLRPGELREVPITLHRADDGRRAPDFTSLMVWALPPGTLRLFEDISLAVPVRLLPGTQPGFAVKSVRLETGAIPQVVITIPTEEGNRYRLEEALQVSGPWGGSDCTTPDTVIDAEGYIVGTGTDVSCYVPCDNTVPSKFFRVTKQ